MAAKRQIHLGAVPYGTGGPGSHTLWLDPEIPGDASVDIDWFIADAPSWPSAASSTSSSSWTASSSRRTHRPTTSTGWSRSPCCAALATQTKHIGLVGTVDHALQRARSTSPADSASST